jgi:hypothetical protein
MLFLIRPSLLPGILQIRGIMYCKKLMQVSIDSEINCAFFKVMDAPLNKAQEAASFLVS